MDDTKVAFVTVKSMQGVPGNYGLQWESELVVPWSGYPVKFWADQASFPDMGTAEPKSTHYVEFQRGRLKPSQDGEEKDPAVDYNYRWNITGWDVEAPAKASTFSSGGSRTDETRISIERQVAFKGAIDLAVGQIIDVNTIIEWTNLFYDCISGVNMLLTPEEPAQLVVPPGQSAAVEVEDPSEDNPFCQAHKVSYNHVQSPRTGVWGYMHLKADKTPCIWDGPQEPENIADAPEDDAVEEVVDVGF